MIDKISQDLLEVSLDIRNDARLKKDYELADKIKTKLESIGISIHDTDSGVEWKFKKLCIKK